MADKKYFKITAGVEFEKEFYVEAENKEEALGELEELNFEKEETVIWSGKIDVDMVDKEKDIVEVTKEEAQPKDVIQSIKEVMGDGCWSLSCKEQGDEQPEKNTVFLQVFHNVEKGTVHSLTSTITRW